MKNPNGSDIPLARELLIEVINGGQVDDEVRSDLELVLGLMYRPKVDRRAPKQPAVKLTPEIERQVKWLLRNTRLTLSEIAHRVGLGKQASGRISEIKWGLRKGKP